MGAIGVFPQTVGDTNSTSVGFPESRRSVGAKEGGSL